MNDIARYGMLMYLAGMVTPLLAIAIADWLTRKKR
jgi:hypothetical protein